MKYHTNLLRAKVSSCLAAFFKTFEYPDTLDYRKKVSARRRDATNF